MNVWNDIQFGPIASSVDKIDVESSDSDSNEKDNAEHQIENWSILKNSSNQFEIKFENIENDEESENEINQKLYVPPNLIYNNQDETPSFVKNINIDSMSDVFESLSSNEFSLSFCHNRSANRSSAIFNKIEQ